MVRVKNVAGGKRYQFGAVYLYVFSTAITANTTVTTAPVGTAFAVTTHATGRGSVYRSDGAKWQFLVNA